MEFLVVGCGSIGRRHIKNLRSLGHGVSGVESDPARARAISQELGIAVYTSIESAQLKDFKAALVCNPTRYHLPSAMKLAKAGLHLFIEKPVSHDLKGINELSRIIKAKRLTALVGCNMRFLPSLSLVKRLIDENSIGKLLSVRIECGFYLPYWHPYEDYRKGYSANRKLGGGVIYDDIHEIDYLYWLLGKPKEVFCHASKISALQIDTEDVAEIFLNYGRGTIAQVHLDYIQRTYRRNYEFIGEKGIILWDYLTKDVELFGEKNNQKKVYHENINTNLEVMFLNEMKHFVKCIEGREKSVNGISSAADILDIAMKCHLSAKTRKVIKL